MDTANKGRVLCVDDEPSILRSLQWLLQKDFEITTALGGEAAMKAVEQRDFDAVLSDQRMPGMTGAQFLSHVKDVSPRSMRLLLTGYSDMPALLSSVNDGEVWQFVSKPWDSAELKGLLRTAVQIAQQPPHTVAAPVVETLPESQNILVITPHEDIAQDLEEGLGKDVRILRATDLVQAVHLLAYERIGTIVAEAMIGTTPITGLLTIVKRKRPEIVSVVIGNQTSSTQVIALINQGQLYRFVPDALKKGYLKHLVQSAMAKHRQLAADPLMQARYLVATTETVLERELMEELALVERAEERKGGGRNGAGAQNQGTGFFRRIRQSLARLLG